MFAVDGSAKTDPSRFVQMKNFLSDVVSYLPVSQSEVNIGVVEYSDRQYAEINFDDYYDTISLRKAIQLIKPSEGALSKISEAIKFVQDDMFSRGRIGVRKVLVLLTDGKEYTAENPVAEAELMKKSGVRILGVAIGNQPNFKKLGEILSPTEKLYVVNQASSLSRLVPSVARDILKTKKGEHNIII